MTEATRTATLLGVGPFNGWFSEDSFLFELYPPLEHTGHSLAHVVTSTIPAYDRFPSDTTVFPTTEDGSLDVTYYCEYGPVLELLDQDHPVEVMHRLGYNTVIMDASARV